MNTDFISAHLADLPEVVDVSTLAVKCGYSTKAIYERARKWRAEHRPELIPEPLVLPGSNCLVFTRTAVETWFRSAVPQATRKRGRPKGAMSRRGAGRAELEARYVEELSK
jgi:hypothetical protein